MKKLLFGVAAFLLLFGFALSQVNAQPVVVPNANEFVEGNAQNGLPFNFIGGPMRYQQIYESTQFSECGNIVQVNFRFSENTAGDSETYPNIFIQLSTTNVTLATLSTTFAENIGLNDVTTVYDGELIFSAPVCGTGPCPFDNTITLQTPFNYNPSDGNLLLDISTSQSTSYQQFDVVNNMPSITRRAFNLNNVNAETGEVDNIGLVTQFVCEPVVVVSPIPTLSEWGLISMAGILGIAGFMIIRRRKVTV